MGKILFIGDSNCMYFAQDEVIFDIHSPRHMQGSKKRKISKKDITFVWKNGKVAHTLTEEILSDLLKKCKVSIDSVEFIVFCFGTVDVDYFMPKMDNYKQTINLYINACIKFANSIQAKPLFLMPIVTLEKEDLFLKWCTYFLEKTKEYGLDNPINPFDFVDRDYRHEAFDTVSHLTFKDSETVIKHIIKDM